MYFVKLFLMALMFIPCLAEASTANKYSGLTVNHATEKELRANSPRIFRKLGIEKIMRDMHLKNIPDGEQAWCDGPDMGSERAGCYIVFYFTSANHIYPNMWNDNDLCGVLARWRSKLDSPNNYTPDSGGASWLTAGNEAMVSEIVGDAWRSCQEYAQQNK